MLCTSRDDPRKSGLSREVPTITKAYRAVYDYTGKIDFSKVLGEFGVNQAFFNLEENLIHCYVCSSFLELPALYYL